MAKVAAKAASKSESDAGLRDLEAASQGVDSSIGPSTTPSQLADVLQLSKAKSSALMTDTENGEINHPGTHEHNMAPENRRRNTVRNVSVIPGTKTTYLDALVAE